MFLELGENVASRYFAWQKVLVTYGQLQKNG